MDALMTNEIGTISNTGPLAALQYLKMDSNNLYGGTLPQWAKQTTRYVVSSLGPFSCPILTLATTGLLSPVFC
jgi:hypothetical protein